MDNAHIVVCLWTGVNNSTEPPKSREDGNRGIQQRTDWHEEFNTFGPFRLGAREEMRRIFFTLGGNSLSYAARK